MDSESTDLLLTLTSVEAGICNAFVKKHHVIAVCLDMEKAYDMVWKDRIIKILTNIGVNGLVILFVANFLTYFRF